jgi:hypothetical protein
MTRIFIVIVLAFATLAVAQDQEDPHQPNKDNGPQLQVGLPQTITQHRGAYDADGKPIDIVTATKSHPIDENFLGLFTDDHWMLKPADKAVDGSYVCSGSRSMLLFDSTNLDAKAYCLNPQRVCAKWKDGSNLCANLAVAPMRRVNSVAANDPNK